MFRQELNFDDPLAGVTTAIVVQAASIPDHQAYTAASRSVFIGLEWGDGISTTEAYVPRSQVKRLIKALQAALDAGDHNNS